MGERESMAAVAAAEWGPVQGSEALSSGARYYYTAGHGGVVAPVGGVSDAVLEAVASTGRWCNLLRERGGFRFLVGEEDCAWALVVMVRPDVDPDKYGHALELVDQYFPLARVRYDRALGVTA